MATSKEIPELCMVSNPFGGGVSKRRRTQGEGGGYVVRWGKGVYVRHCAHLRRSFEVFSDSTDGSSDVLSL